MTGRTRISLNASQVGILQLLARYEDGLTRAQLEAKAPEGVSLSPGNLGPSRKETLEGDTEGTYSTSLFALGYVRPAVEPDDAGNDTTRWHITPKGEKIAGKVKHKHASSRGVKIPHSKLDPLIQRMRATRIYGLEQWSDADLRELRDQLPEEYRDTPLDVLRTKCAGRRKAGAFADPSERIRKAAQAAISAFGRDGKLAKGVLTAEVESRLRKLVDG